MGSLGIYTWTKSFGQSEAEVVANLRGFSNYLVTTVVPQAVTEESLVLLSMIRLDAGKQWDGSVGWTDHCNGQRCGEQKIPLVVKVNVAAGIIDGKNILGLDMNTPAPTGVVYQQQWHTCLTELVMHVAKKQLKGSQKAREIMKKKYHNLEKELIMQWNLIVKEDEGHSIPVEKSSVKFPCGT
eukprot:12662503-Ditylum_brightwellii.AAC.1